MKNKKQPLVYILFSMIVFIPLLLFLFKTNWAGSPTTVSYNDFMDMLNSSSVVSVNMSSPSTLEFSTASGQKFKTDNPNNANLKEYLLLSDIAVKDADTLSTSQRMILGLLFAAFVAFIFINIRKRQGASGIQLNLTNTKKKNSMTTYNFDSVAGNDEAKESLKDIVDFLKNPDKYKNYGARMPKGIILYGAPGTGKTLFAKAVAGEANVPFYAVSGSDFMQMYVGVGASRIRNLFKKAKSNKSTGAVIFIDEIDAIGKSRSNKASGSNDEKDQTLNALLTEMSGFNDSKGIVVIAATNRFDILDEALLRPGRFDRHIEVSLPDKNAREKIIALHLKDKPLDIKEEYIKTLAEKTCSFSGAKLESLINEAAILACKDDMGIINEQHFNDAFSIVIAGREKMDRSSISEKDKKITAVHEAGHATISLLKVPEEKVSKVTIIPTTNGAGGYTMTQSKDTSYHTLDYLKRKIMVLLGGRAAEEIILGKDNITTGAFGDLKESTKIAASMVTEYGMGSYLGLLRNSSLQDFNINLSAHEITEECKKLTESLYEETKNVLNDNKELLLKISDELLIKESLDFKELQLLITNS